MKRRSFLTALGAAIAMPVLPSLPAAQVASFNRYTYGLAVFHARTRAHVSARGIAHCLKVSVPQAEAMIAEMARNGLVKPVFGGPNVRAVSNILKPDTWGLDKAARQARAQVRKDRIAPPRTAHKSLTLETDLSRLIAHLRQVCRDQGMTLSPRCTGAIA
ncbi:hypothetical protein SAMN04488515_3426 [Cognatiyoonia koreensis]|uniref:Tat (Twin-arginine translocation) pathway signal sequence n=1 Tax=Cognatiyoonia koreensis TaxID=364200 RepID=A0A1I0RX54_9RHOB|nr:hypothetical protein [Cognatiyoonia koreensis]SEW46011.1 hypothetical protein SAMN04488515_3426 [Cognatiyoonia koreensis]